MIKIVTIGGGSSYTPELIEGFIKRYDMFPITEICLVDIVEGIDKVNTIANLARRMFEKANLKVLVTVSFNQRQALKNATYVTTQFRVGQLKARYNDEMIPAKYSELGQETNGAGGFFKAMRTIPVIEQLVQDVEDICPDAWIINFTNPAGMVSEYVNRYTNFKRFIGVCNVAIHMRNELAELQDIKHEDLEMHFLGLNHFIFGLNSYTNNTDITKETLNTFINSNISMNNIEFIPWNKEFLENLKLIPCSYLQYFFQLKEKLNHQEIEFKENKIRAQVVMDYEKELFIKYEDENLNTKPIELENRGGAYYSDVACDVLASIHNNSNKIHTVNIKNNGHVNNIGYDDTIEITCKITKDGPVPLKEINYMPDKILGIYTLMKNYELQTCKAIKNRSYSECLLALNFSPHVMSDSDIKKVFDELVLINTKYLKQYN